MQGRENHRRDAVDIAPSQSQHNIARLGPLRDN
jgi:hypothetical protein